MFETTMTEQVQITEPTGLDTYGGPTYSGATTTICPAWISRKPREVRTHTGETRVAAAEISLGHPVGGGSVPVPTPEARITLPDGSQPAILAVASIVDPEGHLHTKIFV